MKKFTELLKVLLIVGALTTFAFSAAATDVIIFCEVSEEICATVEVVYDFDGFDLVFFEDIPGTHLGTVIVLR